MMEWPRYSLREVAPAIPIRNSFDPEDTVWHLGLDQIEGQCDQARLVKGEWSMR